ncbi:Zn-ribbon domain-containing OB-fold protein [Nesterenkonia ebinurensis]|uniref:Zn-ribbon domain-containing OB-fold protein n=1 Tax=Nesterenkonia ebinurensis TaxID=2608252 RepID=UPI00123D1D59|nr:OB-fold domain-containing protein [Nesterenkonia ebinurensis]
MSDAELVLEPEPDIGEGQPAVLTGSGLLQGGRCRACAAHSFPRAYVCHRCHASDIEIIELPADGTLYSWTTVHISPAFETPYTLGYVDLLPDLRVFAQVLVTDERLACNLPVTVRTTQQSPTGWAFVEKEGELS